MLIRRTASLRLVQMVTGGSLGDAAGFLAITSPRTALRHKGRSYYAAAQVRGHAKNRQDPLGFETALENLAAELDDPTTQLINYQQRRRALETWFIDETTWNDIVSQLPHVSGSQPSELGDRKRQVASIYVWLRLTSGEHRFAPRPIQDIQPPDIQEAWKKRLSVIWHLMLSDRPRYIDLRTQLNALGVSLARTIDNPL